MIKYFLYAQKCANEEDRQILSVESQLAELRKFAKKEKITIIREFTESKTAKQPGWEWGYIHLEDENQVAEVIELLKKSYDK